MNELWNISDWINSQEYNWALLLFTYFVAQLINVIFSTLKSYFTIKGTKLTATIFNTASYTIGAVITFVIANLVNNVWLVIIITAVTNFIGVYYGLWLADKLRKDKLWRISVTIKVESYLDLIKQLKENNIKFITFETDWDKVKLIDIFSHTREESSKIYKIFEKYDDIKYTISSNSHLL